MGLKSFKRQSLKNKSATAGIVGSSELPVISSIVICDSSYNDLDDTALNPAGGYAKIVGSNFESNCIVYFNGNVLTTSFISSRELRIQTPAITVGSYNLMLFNLATGQGAIYLNLNVSNFPTIVTSASSPLDVEYETKPISASISATGDGPITYSIVPGLGNLPDGVTLSSDGTLSGVAPIIDATTTYTFVVQAKDAQNQDATRQFSLTVNIDVVDWTSPSEGATISAYEYTQLTPTSLSATSRAGYDVVYASNTLPTGFSISGSNVVGQSNTVGSSNVTIVATSNTTNKTATRNVQLVVNQDVVTWSNPTPGAVFTAYEYTPFSNVSLSATSAAGFDVTYTANGLPAGLTLSGNTISGTINAVSTSNVTLTAVANTTNRFAAANVQFVVSEDVVTWSSPASNTSLSVSVNDPISNITLAATSAAGFDVTYAANGLPTGVTYANGIISGTPTVGGEIANTTVTATATTTGRSATRYITWSINIAADSFWRNVSLMLSADSAVAVAVFNDDNSTNKFDVVPQGSVQAADNNPYQGNYYSVEYGGTSNSFISIPHNSNLSIMSGSSNTFVAECWVYWNVVNANMSIMDKSGRNSVSFQNWAVELNASKQIRLVWGASGTPGTSGIGILQTTVIPVAGKWYHFAFVKSNADWALFLDGTRITNYSGLNTANDANPSALRIGYGIQGEANAGYMNGFISNVRVYNGPAGSAPYAATSTTITPPTTPALPGTNIYAVVNQSNRLKDNSATNATVTGGSTTKISAVSPFVAPANVYGSGYFNGSGSFLTLGSQSGFSMGTGDFTIEMWVNISSLSATRTLYDTLNSGDATGTGRMAFQVTTGGTIQLFTGAGSILTSGGTVVAGRWNHIAVCRSSGSTRIFLNGTQVNTTYPDTNNYVVGNSNRPIIGINGYDNSSNPMLGYISDVRVVKGTALYTTDFPTSLPTAPLTAVSGTTLLTLQNNGPHNNSTFKDDSGFNNLITQAGNVTQGTFAPYGDNWSAYFNGSTDYHTYTIPAFGTADFTVEFWIYKQAYTTGTYNGIWDQSDTGFTGNLGVGIGASGTDVRWILGGTTTSAGANSFTLNKWTHIALVRSGGTLRLYVDGVLKISASNTTNWTRTVFNIGRWVYWTTSYQCSMSIANLRVVQGTGVYTADFNSSLPTGPLPAVSGTVLLLFNSNRFLDTSPGARVPTTFGAPIIQRFSPYPATVTTNRYSVVFNGTTDYLTVASSALYDLSGHSNWTIECWINTRAAVGSQQYFTGRNSTSQWTIYSVDATLYTQWRNVTTGKTITSSIQANTWYHVALVKDGSTYTMYVNGSVAGTLNDAEALLSGNCDVRIGYSVNNNFCNGYISDARLVVGSSIVPPAGGPTGPLTAVAGTRLLTCQGYHIKDDSPIKATVTAGTTTVAVSDVSPFAVTSNSTMTYNTTSFGGSIYFDGTGDYLQTAANLIHTDITQSDYTIEAWVYNMGAGAERYIFSQRGTGSGWEMRINADNTVSTFFTGSTTFTSSATVPANAWTHIAASRIGTTIRMFFNGKSAMSSSTQSNGTSAYASYGLMLGNSTSAGGGLMLGYIADARVVKGRALYTADFIPPAAPLTPTAETTILFTGRGGITDASRTVDIETSGNIRSSTSVVPFNGARSYYFDGNGDYLTVSTGTGTIALGAGNFTIETWVRFASNNGTYNPFIRVNGGGQLDFGYDFSVGQLKYSTNVAVLANAWTPTVGTWYHVALVRNSGNAKIYVDGVNMSGAGVSDTFNHSLNAVSAYYRIGGSDYSASHILSGHLADFRITKGVARTISKPVSTLIAK